MTRRITLAVLSLTVALGGNAVASEIYRWTDAEGNVHYVDRPSGMPTEQRLEIASNRTNNTAVQASIQARLNRQADRLAAREQEAAAAESFAAEEAKQKLRAQECQLYRDRMESYLQARRLYREDESGERVYLDEKQILEARSKVQAKIQETCD